MQWGQGKALAKTILTLTKNLFYFFLLKLFYSNGYSIFLLDFSAILPLLVLDPLGNPPLECLLILSLALYDCHRRHCAVPSMEGCGDSKQSAPTKAALTSALAKSSELPACNYPLVLFPVLFHSSSFAFPVCFPQPGSSSASFPHLELSLSLSLPSLAALLPLTQAREGSGVTERT